MEGRWPQRHTLSNAAPVKRTWRPNESCMRRPHRRGSLLFAAFTRAPARCACITTRLRVTGMRIGRPTWRTQQARRRRSKQAFNSACTRCVRWPKESNFSEHVRIVLSREYAADANVPVQPARGDQTHSSLHVHWHKGLLLHPQCARITLNGNVGLGAHLSAQMSWHLLVRTFTQHENALSMGASETRKEGPPLGAHRCCGLPIIH